MQPFINVAVARKEVSCGSCCNTLVNSNPFIAENLDTFSSRIQGPSDSLENSIYIVMSYLHTSLKFVQVVQWDNLNLTEFITTIHIFVVTAAWFFLWLVIMDFIQFSFEVLGVFSEASSIPLVDVCSRDRDIFYIMHTFS